MYVMVDEERPVVRNSLPLLPPLLALAAALAVLVDAPIPFRAAVVLPFLAIVPGWTLVTLIDIRDNLARVTLAVATSLAIATLAAGLSLYAGVWSPDVILGLLVVWTLIGSAAGQIWQRDRRAPRTSDEPPEEVAAGSAGGVGIPPAPPSPSESSSSHRNGAGQRVAPPIPADPTRNPRKRRFSTDLSDDEWRAVERLLPPPLRHHTHDPRDLCDAILYAKSAGFRWRNLPSDFPPQRKVRRFHRTLEQNGAWPAIEAVLEPDLRHTAPLHARGRDRDPHE